jgi:hypothetical protein
MGDGTEVRRRNAREHSAWTATGKYPDRAFGHLPTGPDRRGEGEITEPRQIQWRKLLCGADESAHSFITVQRLRLRSGFLPNSALSTEVLSRS